MSEQTKQLALQTLNEIKGEMAKRDETRYLMAMIMAISAFESQSGWIPCSERLPDKTGRYKVTFQVGSEAGAWRETAIINYKISGKRGTWVLPISGWKTYTAIAWTEADEPYQGEA